MDILEFSKNELELLLKSNDDKEYYKKLNNDILDVVKLLLSQKHSLASIEYLIKNLTKIIYYRPLTPLEGDDLEFEEQVEKDGFYCSRNKRYAGVIRKIDVKTGEVKYYDLTAKLFNEPEDSKWCIGEGSMQEINEFPYTPNQTLIMLKYPVSKIPIAEQLLKGDYVEKGSIW